MIVIKHMKTARNEKEVGVVRQKVLDGALDIISKEGFNSLTMRKLGARIGMTAPNIYNYYSSKDALYITLVIRGFEMLRDDLDAAYQSSDNVVHRARAMINAYMAFGINNSRYYDIMFTSSTPKYNDYLGTPYEKLSEIEYNISMGIADLAMKSASEILGNDVLPKTVITRVIQLWSFLHGMVSLYNSHVVSYVSENIEDIYGKSIDELIVFLTEGRT